MWMMHRTATLSRKRSEKCGLRISAFVQLLPEVGLEDIPDAPSTRRVVRQLPTGLGVQAGLSLQIIPKTEIVLIP